MYILIFITIKSLIDMKKLLLFTGSLIFFTLTTHAQLTTTDYLMDMAPAHIQQRLENAKLAKLAYSTEKNNSYDTPMSIEHYNVDIANVETLMNIYEYTYTPAGRLLYMTKLDASMTNQTRTTFNYTYFGEISSMINQTWNGWGWDFSDRVIYNYSGALLLSEIIYEDYNNITFDWDFDYGNKFEYIGGDATPSLLLVTSSNDDINWIEDLKFHYTYGAGTTPETVEVLYYDDNFLNWIPAEKWEISDWGPSTFKADFYFNAHEGMNKITDNTIGKEDVFRIYPADFYYHSSYDEIFGDYTFNANIDSEFDGNNRTLFNINEFNGTSYDSTSRYVVTYDVCYGLEKQISENYVSPGVWTIDYGFHFDGTKVPYSSSCYVSAYDYYDGFSVAEPNGYRTDRWVINQASELSIEDLDPFSTLSVYPNPATTELTVSRIGDLTQNSTITVMGLDGKVIQVTKWVAAEQTIDISAISSGIYILQMEMDDEITVRKFVKE